MALTEALFVIVGLLSALYMWCQRNYSYWQRKGVPYEKPTPIIGNTKEMFLMKTGFSVHLNDIYSKPEFSDAAVVGVYTLNKPSLIIRDPELVKLVLIKDFNKFHNRYGRCDPHRDSLGSKNLFFVRNPEWKDIRTKITPVFTSGKVKQMYPLVLEVAQELETYLTQLTKDSGKHITEIKEICALFTTDSIATIAYGVRANSLKNPNADFRMHGRTVFDFTLMRSFTFFMVFFLPKLVSVLRIKFFTTEFTNFMRNTVNHVMQERERTGTTRNDLIDILVNMKREAISEPDKNHFAKDNDFLIAQAGVFLTAGFETSSSTMAFALFELAKQPEIQRRLREELNEAFLESGGNLSYDKINTLEYLGMVVDEVLRMYPVLPFLDREYMAVKDEPAFTLKPYYDYTLENGTPVFIPVLGLQRDPKYWPNPNHFDPERFSPENRKNILPMTYLPFGTGPHNCIGSRIGLLQSKIGLAHFLKNHMVRFNDQTPKEIRFDPKALVLQADEGINLEIICDRLYDERAGVNQSS